MLPVNYAGLALIPLGVGLMVTEHFVPGFGVLGIGGIMAFVIGSVMLIDTDAPGFRIPWPLIAGAAAASALFLMLVLSLAVRARDRRSARKCRRRNLRARSRGNLESALGHPARARSSRAGDRHRRSVADRGARATRRNKMDRKST